MLAKVHSCAIVGLEAYIVDVEVDFNPRAGIPSFTIVGLPVPVHGSRVWQASGQPSKTPIELRRAEFVVEILKVWMG